MLERQKSGRIHYHLLVVTDEDIRTGVDFQAFGRKDYRSAPDPLRREWKSLRKTAPRYRFGRTELLPVMSNGEAIGRYVGKYISKHIDARETRDKGARLVEYSRGARLATTRFAWATDNASSWRRKVGLFVDMVASVNGDPRRSFDMLKDHLGPRWGYKWREFILALPDPETGEIDDGTPSLPPV